MAAAPSAPGTRTVLRHVLTHLLTPLLMCLGMALAYQGAFHQPTPHHLPVAVVGTTPQARALADGIAAEAGPALEVSVLPDRAAAERRLMDRDLVGAFLPDPARPQLLVATGNSDTSAMAAEKVFQTVTRAQGVPLTLTELTPMAAGDPTNQGIFFLMVALSIGSYGSVAVIGAAGAALSVRLRALVGLGTSLAVSLIGAVTAGPVFHVVDHDLAAVWAIGWLYSAGVVAIGTGLHTFFKRWTTLALMVLFVMLNFTSSGGIYRPELLNGFFATLHSFWTGAGFVEGVRSLLYFDGGAGFTGHLLTLAAWFALGLLTLLAAHLRERHLTARARRPDPAEEEMAEAVAV